MSAATNFKDANETRHDFGGCNNLLAQYRAVGAALMTYQKESGFSSFLDLYSDLRKKESLPDRNLRHALAFISVEVMESYLDDLLDLDVQEEKLFIQTKTKFPLYPLVSAGGILLTVAAGLFMVDSGYTVSFSFALTILMAIPFVVLWHMSPKQGLALRLIFARALSQQISKRRGNDGDRIQTRNVFSKLIQNKIVTTPRGVS